MIDYLRNMISIIECKNNKEKMFWKVVLLLLISLSYSNGQVLFEDDFTSSLTDKWTLLIPMQYDQGHGKVTFNVNPVGRPVDPPFPFGQVSATQGGLMPTSLMSGINVLPNETLRVTLDASFVLKGYEKHPFGRDVKNAEDDPRLGTCGFLIQEPSSRTTACAFYSNNWIWNWHDRFAYADSSNVNFQTGEVYPSTYKGFISWKKASRSKKHNNKVTIEYDRLNQEFRWYHNNVLTRRSRNPGGWPQQDGKDVVLYQHVDNPSTSKVDLPLLTLTFACVTEMDKVDYFNPRSTKGLVNHNQPDYVFNLPSSWFSSNTNSVNDLQYQAFGQSLHYTLRSVTVEKYLSKKC